VLVMIKQLLLLLLPPLTSEKLGVEHWLRSGLG